MLQLLFALLLCLQWVAGDDATEFDRQHKASASTPHVLSKLLVPFNPKFAVRAAEDGCPTGYHICANNVDCCDSGYFCCTDSFGGCCPVGSSCTVGSNTCSGFGFGGSSGGSSSGSEGSSGGGSSPSSSSSKTTTLKTTTTSKSTVTGVSGQTVGPSVITPLATPSSSTPALGGVSTGGSPHSISVAYIGMTASFATVIGIIALGRTLF